MQDRSADAPVSFLNYASVCAQRTEVFKKKDISAVITVIM